VTVRTCSRAWSFAGTVSSADAVVVSGRAEEPEMIGGILATLSLGFMASVYCVAMAEILFGVSRKGSGWQEIGMVMMCQVYVYRQCAPSHSWLRRAR